MANNVFYTDAQLPATSKLRLDGSSSGNTYISETTADTITLTAGGNATGVFSSSGTTLTGTLTVSGNTTLGDAGGDDTTINGQLYQLTTDALGYKLYRTAGGTGILISGAGDTEIEFGTDNGSGTNTTYWTIGKDNTDNSFRISASQWLGVSDQVKIDASGMNAYGTFTATGATTLSTIAEIVSDTDKFLMSDSGVVKYVTGANLLTYIGAGTGTGNVSNTGTPLNNQVAIWTNATTIEGDADLTFDGTDLTVGSGGSIYSGDDFVLPSLGTSGSPSNHYLMCNNTGTGGGKLYVQAGAGSSAYGGGLILYGHSHASQPGWVKAGISSGSGGKFSVNTQGLGGGTDKFTVDASGVVSITADGSNAATLTESDSGDFTIASTDDLRLDSGGSDIVLRGASSQEFGRLSNDDGNFRIRNITSNKDINIEGNDGGSTITALSLDMSASGYATFYDGATFSGHVIISDAGNGNSPILSVTDTADTEAAWFTGNRAGDTGAYIAIRHLPTTAAESNRTGIKFQAKDDGDNTTTYAAITQYIKDYTGGTEDGYLAFSTIQNATLTEVMRIGDNVGIGCTDPTGKLEIQQAQITTQFDRDSFLRLHPSATTDSGGFTNMFFGTSATNNYGVAIGGLREGTDGEPSFSIRMLDDAISGTEVLNISSAGTATFAGDVEVGGAASITPNANFSNLAITDAAHSGISILSGNTSDGAIYFGDTDSNNRGQFKYLHGTNQFNFSTDDTLALTLDSSQNAIFEGTVLIDGVANYTGLEIKGSGASRPSIQWSNVTQGDLGRIYGTEGNALVLATGASNTTALTLDSSQNATFAGTVDIDSIPSVGSDTDKFLMSNSGVVSFATGAEVLSYIGAGSGSGNVSNTGTPLNNQLAIWTDATTIEGDADLTYSGTILTVGGAVDINTLSGGRYMTLDAPTLGGYITFETGGAAYADIGSASGIIGSGTDTDLLMIKGRGGKSLALGSGGATALIFDTNQTATFEGDIVISAGKELIIGSQSSAESPLGITIRDDQGDAPVGVVIHNENTGDSADAQIAFETQAALDFSIGIDRSDGNNFVFSRAGVLGTNNVFTINGTTATFETQLDVNTIPSVGSDTDKFLMSNGGLVSFATGAEVLSYIGAGTGSGNVSNTGTPVNNQIAIWTNATTIEGDSDLTFDGSNLTTTGTVTWSGGGSAESNSAYDNMITGFSDSGSSTITLTLTQQDGGTLTTSFSVPQGTGDGNVSNTGTPLDNQVAIWTDATTVEGSANMTFSGTVLTVTGGTSTEWDTAYTDRFKWNGTSDGLLASTGRTSLGGTTIGQNYFTLTNPGAITFPRQNADNTLSSLSASDFRTAIGAGTGSGTVTGVTGATPITSTGGTAPEIGINNATGSTVGAAAISAGTGISISDSSGVYTITNSAPASGSAVTGSGTENYLPKWSGSSSLTNSTIFYDASTPTNLEIQNQVDEGSISFRATNASSETQEYFVVHATTELTRFYKGVNFNDDVKLTFGDIAVPGDLEIWHDEDNSYITDTGTGSLYIDGSSVYIRANSNENAVVCLQNSEVQIFHNGSEKMATKSTGIAVTGVITATGGNSTEWNTAYDNHIVSLAFSGTSTTTLTLTQQDGGTISNTFSNPQGTVTSVSSGTGDTLSVTNGTTTPVLEIAIGAVVNGGTKLANGDQIYDFVNDNYLALGGGTMTGDIVLDSNAHIQLDTNLAASQSSGTIMKDAWGDTVVYGTIYYLESGGEWFPAANDDDDEFAINLLAIAVGTNSTTHGMLYDGIFYDSSHGFTIGAPLYLGDSSSGPGGGAGGFTNTAPSGGGDKARVLGYAISDDEIYFRPDNTWVTID